jgi:hypothetical protein
MKGREHVMSIDLALLMWRVGIGGLYMSILACFGFLLDVNQMLLLFISVIKKIFRYVRYARRGTCRYKKIRRLLE